jgi:hypothetical protein
MISDLNRRIAELSHEIRAYPTPIARCDEQLPALIEERARLLARLHELESEPRCGPDAQWTNDGGTNAA